MVASFLCIFGFLILVLSASWLQWALFSGLQFVGAKSSESCLIEMQSVGEVSDFDFKVKARLFGFPR
ncbi:hypothetical protein CRN62_07805 [Vibrio vulnificus]|nr:hypothetical protein [Vibrio vulnificus]EGR0642093.1 hypothetical protein [Vibrio vulnificus]EGR0651491.1 hypothetical protein [Vibrio vulnificus]POB73970.1 hypothetical protein CRN62_07805 [Vibrio vulnificus]POB76403.1 hypothetical protein CRN35_20335 [Vibrio vulnificus]